MERIKHKKYKYRTVSLFAGIGGFDIALSNVGFDMIWANDFDKYCVQTFKENVHDNIVLGDINDHIDEIPEHEVLVGGFPCQPFSTLGKLKGFDDERGTLFFTIKKILKKHNTKVVILENVKNLLNHDGGKTFKRMKDELEELGYNVFYQVLNSQDYGVPQRRNRAIIVAFKKKYFNNEPFIFPEKQPLKITAQDLLDDDVDEKYFMSTNIIGTILGKGTKGYIVKPTIDQPICKTLTATMHKMHRASQDNYFTDIKNHEKYCDKSKTNIRKLTPNECRKLQGFPEDWKQVVSDTQAYKQFGNAVTVDVIYAVGKEVFEYIERNKKGEW